MNHIAISASRLSTWLSCKWQYYCKYNLKLPDVSNPKTLLGSCIHEVLELISCPSKQEKRKKYIIFSVQSKELHSVIIRLFNRLFKRYAITEVVGKGDKELNLRELGLKLLVDAFCRGYDVDLKVLDVEKKFDIQVSENISIKGFIDKVCELSEDTLELVDYKSGVPYSVDKCNEEEFQPFLYKIAVKTLYPKYKYSLFNFHFLKNKKTVSVLKTDEQLDEFLKFSITQGILMLKLTEKDATCTKSFKCNTMCSFKEPNQALGYSGCPAFYDKNGESIYK